MLHFGAGLIAYKGDPAIKENGQPESHELTRDGEKIATVQRCPTGWFWYGMQRNTAQFPVATLDQAKKDCEAHCRTRLEQVETRE